MIIRNHKDLLQAIRQLSSVDLASDRWVFSLKKLENHQSTNQRGLYWMWLKAAEKQTGQDRHSLHGAIKKERGIVSTSTLDKEEYSKHLEWTFDWLINAGIDIRKPGDMDYDSFVEYVG